MQLFIRCIVITEIISGMFTLFYSLDLPPSFYSVIIVGSRVCHTILRIVMRKVIIGTSGIPGIKSKLKDFHSRETTVMDKLANRICHITKILRNDLLPAKGLLHFAEQIDPGTFFPVTANGIFCTVWNGKILVNASDLVDP